MTEQHGTHIWYELMTNDPDGAVQFYENILPWKIVPGENPEMDYRHINAPDASVGGVMKLPDSAPMPPAWMGYIAVDDVDGVVAKTEAAGGQTYMPATDIPNVGRIAMITDPQGVPFYVMKGAREEVSQAFAYDAPREGHCAWNELATTDQAGAMTYYGDMFGWTKDGDMDMGPEMGRYDFVRDNRGMLGGVMTKPKEMPVSAWSYYFRVPDMDVAVEAIKVNGGRIIVEPMEIPGGDYAMTAQDPQGAFFSLVGARK